MTPTTFPCPFCGRKMGVGPELLGHKVRCPHCKQVILAPTAGVAPAPAAAPPPPPAVVPPPPPPPVAAVTPPTTLGLPDPLPQFNVGRQEAQDSIFGEATEEGDDVFGASPRKPAVPELPPPVVPPPPPPPVAIYSPPPPVAAYSPPPPPIVPFQPPAAVPAPPVANQPPPGAYPAPAPADPFAGFVAAPIPAAVAPVPVPVAPPPAAVPANPWAGFDQVPTPRAMPPAPPATRRGSEPEPIPAAMIDDEPVEPRRGSRDRRPERDTRRAQSERGRPRDGSGGGAAALIKVGFFLLIPYALLMTVLAVYGLFIREGGRVPDGHPLSLIPDGRGEFPPADRKKVGKLGVALDGPLPPELRAELGKTVTVGAVEVEPVSVAVRKLSVVTEPEKGKAPAPRQTDVAVVLTMKVKNLSADLTFHPLDPAFNRKEAATDSPPTALVVGKSTYAGGPISWPFGKGVKRAYEAAQLDDDKPLAPGESRSYAVISRPDAVRAVRGARDTIVWRVQVRRGLVEYRGREVPVTALVGVEFKASDVTTED